MSKHVCGIGNLYRPARCQRQSILTYQHVSWVFYPDIKIRSSRWPSFLRTPLSLSVCVCVWCLTLLDIKFHCPIKGFAHRVWTRVGFNPWVCGFSPRLDYNKVGVVSLEWLKTQMGNKICLVQLVYLFLSTWHKHWNEFEKYIAQTLNRSVFVKLISQVGYMCIHHWGISDWDAATTR